MGCYHRNLYREASLHTHRQLNIAEFLKEHSSGFVKPLLVAGLCSYTRLFISLLNACLQPYFTCEAWMKKTPCAIRGHLTTSAVTSLVCNVVLCSLQNCDVYLLVNITCL